LELKSGENFFIRSMANPSSEWTRSLVLSPSADSLLNVNVAIRYLPMLASFNDYHLDTLVITSDQYTKYEIPLKGQSSRPILVEVPVARTATDTTSFSFVANWDAAFDATGYYLSVYSFTGESNSLSEGFDTFLDNIVPADWSLTFDTKYASPYGEASPSLVFTSSQDTLLTERYLFPIEKISFWVKGISATGSKFYVDGFDGQNWIHIDTLFSTDMSIGVKEILLPVSNTFSRFRMMYEKNNGNMLFDDFTVYFTQNVSYVCHYKHTANLNDTLVGLLPNTTYQYRLQATDKTEYYEHITAYSNEIEVLTKSAKTDPSQLTIRSTSSGYQVEVEQFDPDYCLYIYSVQGQLLAEVQPTSNIIDIPTLPANTFCILKYGLKGNVKRSDPFAYLFYQIFI